MVRRTVVLIVAQKGYQPVEYGETKKVLEAGGMTVRTASNGVGMAVAKACKDCDPQYNTGDNTTTEAELAINNIIPDRYDGIFFIGGPGAMEHLDNETSYALIKKVAQAEILFGAICISPRILAKAGVLKDKHATGWDGDNELDAEFEKYGVIREQKNVVVDGNIVTATGPAAAQEFGTAILHLLQKLPEE